MHRGRIGGALQRVQDSSKNGGMIMAQYCRYCSSLVVGDTAYCTAKKKEIPEHLAKTTNYCPYYDLNPIDAFGENEKGYQPRHKKEPEENIPGQMSLEEFFSGAGGIENGSTQF